MNESKPTTYRERFLHACTCQAVDRPPIWMMRQAGRSLPEYRALKEGCKFTELVQTPELAAEVTLQPIRRFGMDAAILFSDIMTPLEGMGVGIEFCPGPVIAEPVRSAAAVDRLRPIDPEERSVGSSDSNHELGTGGFDEVVPVGEATDQRCHPQVCRVGEFGYESRDISEDHVVSAGWCHIARLYSRRSRILQGWASTKTVRREIQRSPRPLWLLRSREAGSCQLQDIGFTTTHPGRCGHGIGDRPYCL